MKLAVLGASGRTGRQIVELALEAGHHVRALVRSRGKLQLTHERLEYVMGDATDAAAVQRAVEGCDAVISALGPTPERADICSTGTRHVIAAGARRYVAVSGAGIDVKGDQKDFVGKVMSFLVKTITGAYFRDKVLEYQLLEQSPLAWTLVRPPGLVDKPARGNVRSSLARSPGASITRADLAAYTLACVTNDELIRKAPFVAG